MAGRGGVRTGPRILLLLLLIIVLVFGGLLWFDYLGIIDAKNTLSPVLSLVTKRKRTKLENVESTQLLDDQRIAKQWEALDLKEQELKKREEGIAAKEQQVNEMLDSLKEREKALEDKEKSFNVRANLYENKSANLEQNARYLTGMPPQNAVEILMNMSDQDAIDHMRAAERLAAQSGEASIVSYWLKLMADKDAARAAQIQRKMALKPAE